LDSELFLLFLYLLDFRLQLFNLNLILILQSLYLKL
jgi:hypothetical protein